MKRERRIPFLLFVVCLVAAMPFSWGAGSLEGLDLAKPVNPKVTLCHHPPEDPANVQTIEVRLAAVRAHLAHGDSLGECPQVCAGVPSAVPKAGQTGCWDTDGIPIDCAGTGQDGEYQKCVSVDPRFTDNGDGTVKDNLTGLIWSKDANCFGLLTWVQALDAANTLTSGSCGLTDGSVVGNWRLPNIKELQSLLDYGQSEPALPPGHPFTGVQIYAYWSSSNYAVDPNYAFLAVSQNGDITNRSKTMPLYVWPVRGGQ